MIKEVGETWMEKWEKTINNGHTATCPCIDCRSSHLYLINAHKENAIPLEQVRIEEEEGFSPSSFKQ
jgi:hypothetical protein